MNIADTMSILLKEGMHGAKEIVESVAGPGDVCYANHGDS
jgi:hypothetical protein